MGEGDVNVATAPPRLPARRLRRDRALRRVALGALTLFVVVGLTGFLGSRTRVTSAEAGGYRLSVTYPAITRPGLPARWEYEVERDGGFDGPVRLATTFRYLHLFDLTGIEPDPSSQTADRGRIVWEFDPPPGDVLRVSFDAAVEAGFHEVPDAVAAVVVGDAPVVEVPFTTLVIP